MPLPLSATSVISPSDTYFVSALAGRYTSTRSSPWSSIIGLKFGIRERVSTRFGQEKTGPNVGNTLKSSEFSYVNEKSSFFKGSFENPRPSAYRIASRDVKEWWARGTL